MHLPSQQPQNILHRMTRVALLLTVVVPFVSAAPAFAQLIANGTYTIINKNSVDAVDVTNVSTTEGALIQQYGANGQTNQQWTLTNLGSNYVELINVNSGMALEVNNNSTATGQANIDQWPYNGGNSQRWLVVSEGSGYYELVNENSGDALDVPNSSTAQGIDLDQWPPSDTANQLWTFTAVAPPNLIANGTYFITAKNSGLVLDDYNLSTTEGTQIDQWPLNSQNQQKWNLTNLGSNYVELINGLSGYALEVYNFSTANGGTIDQWPYLGGKNQIWQIVSKGSGEYQLTNENSGLALDVTGASTTEGTFLQQYAANGQTNQQFSFTATSAPSGGGNSNTPTITVNGSSNVAPISFRQLGVNLGAWASMDVKSTSPNGPNEVASMGSKFFRWPGGSYADDYHWAGETENNPYGPQNCYITNANTDPYTEGVSSASTDNAWPNYQSSLAQPSGYETAVTVAYGTNTYCNGGGDPNEAAAWVANAKSNGYNVNYWTVGNEEYGSWEDDLHYYSPASSYGHTGGHFGSIYASLMNGSSGFYQKMKASNSNAQIGAIIEIEALNASDGWNKAILGCSNPTGTTSCGTIGTGAQFDFLEVHDYAQAPGQESDSYLLNGAISDFDNSVSLIRSELTATNHSATTPIMLGEFNSVYGNIGKQTMSIVNALYIGEMYGEILKNKINIATMWFGTGGSQGCGNNNSSSLYGWQNYGAYDAVANNTSYNWTNCGSGPNLPEGTILPNGRALYLVNQFAHDGEHLLSSSVGSQFPNVRDYSASSGSGYNHLLINLDPSNSATVTVGVSNPGKTSFTGQTITYGKAQYDNSQYNTWTGPAYQSLGTVGANVTLTLPPYSITVLEMQ